MGGEREGNQKLAERMLHVYADFSAYENVETKVRPRHRQRNSSRNDEHAASAAAAEIRGRRKLGVGEVKVGIQARPLRVRESDAHEGVPSAGSG